MDNSSSFCRVPLCSHLLQQCLRSFCIDSQWVYAVFWRILPRNFPPPRWEIGGYLDRTKANKRNWILVWEDGFCDFARATSRGSFGLQPDLFFKMSHEVYNYGEGLMGKVSSDNGHKWVYKDPSQPENAPSWQTSIDPHPRTWEAQFKSGIKTILVIAVREGLVQLGSSERIQEDFNFVVLLQRKFNNLLITLPSSLLSSPSSPVVARMGTENKSETDHAPANSQRNLERQLSWNGPVVINEAYQRPSKPNDINNPHTTLIPHLSGDYHATIMPSMNSLQALLSKLPSVTSPPTTQITLPNRHIITDNGDFSLGCHASPLIRSLSAPHGDGWLQEPTNPSATTTPSIASPSKGLLVNSTDQQHQHLHLHPQQQQQSLSNAFVAVDSGANVGDYTYLGDLMGG